jgi:competence protein ComEA
MSELEPERREGIGGDRLPRPLPTRSFPERAAAWLSWLGPGRLVGTVVVAAAVVAGAIWLTRTPTPPTEQQLPFTAGTAPTTTGPPDASESAADGTEVAPGSDHEEVPVATAVVVHVAGAVAGPGVYRLDGDARVHTAIDAAGGATADADLDGLNLAATVADGQRIYVPVVGEVDPATVPSGGPSVGAADAGTSGTSPVTGPVDLNRAGVAELETLPGIGPATAAAIVDDRARNGPFASVDDLDRVSGIGPAKLAAIRDLVTV